MTPDKIAVGATYTNETGARRVVSIAWNRVMWYERLRKNGQRWGVRTYCATTESFARWCGELCTVTKPEATDEPE